MITKLKRQILTGAAALSLTLAPAAFAQQTASVHGHANDEVGVTIKDGEVRLTTDVSQPVDKQKFAYVFKTDANGDYKGDGITPGTYSVELFRQNVLVDYENGQTFKPGEDKVEQFDLSRPDYIAKLSPERRKQIEDFKAKNAAASEANKSITTLNATITGVRADLKSPSPNYDKDLTDSKAAVDQRPTEPILWVLYGDVLSAKADAAANEDRKNKTNPNTDDAVKKSYSDSIDAYKKAADLYTSAAKPNPDVQATVYNELGNVYAKTGDTTDAATAYDKAISIQPQNKGMFYANEAAVLFNAHQDAAALDAANNAIAADPSRPNPYFIKGQELLAKATVDQKTGKIVPPPGCVDSYQKYLELAPDGPQAASVKETLGALGEKVETHYSAGKKAGH